MSPCLLSVLLSGCFEKTNYKYYVDKKKKGEKVFLTDLRSCQEFSNENIKRSEGSKGAGELVREKNFIFSNCMKRNYWILNE